jgi:hypothetical protein
MSVRIPWYFRDLTTDPVEEYMWEVNPREFSLAHKKAISFANTSAPDGKTIIWQGRDEPRRIQFSGTILREEQYEEMLHWFGKRHQVQVEDDLGRTFWLVITDFQPKRERSRSFPWKHSYTCEAIVVDWQ